jgi:hypothetical protein
MAKLIYVANTSLDGYNQDQDGDIDFGAPDEEYFPVGTYLYGTPHVRGNGLLGDRTHR